MSQSAADDMLTLATQMVEAKGNASGEYKEEMVKEVLGMIEDAINMELLSRMTKEQMDEFNKLLQNDDTTDAQITEYIQSCNIDINNINAVALTKFRIAYLGA